MLPFVMIDIQFYVNENGNSPFSDWFNDLDSQAVAKVTISVERLRCGNFSNIKTVGEGVQEYRINWGAGYRLYFGFDGKSIVVLLIGGTKQRQDKDIKHAKILWLRYKKRKDKK
jgi:putative addiction module killer protein